MNRHMACGDPPAAARMRSASLNRGVWFDIVAWNLHGAFAETVAMAVRLSTACSRRCRHTFRLCLGARRQERPDALPHALAASCRECLVLRALLAPGPCSRRFRVLP